MTSICVSFAVTNELGLDNSITCREWIWVNFGHFKKCYKIYMHTQTGINLPVRSLGLSLSCNCIGAQYRLTELPSVCMSVSMSRHVTSASQLWLVSTSASCRQSNYIYQLRSKASVQAMQFHRIGYPLLFHVNTYAGQNHAIAVQLVCVDLRRDIKCLVRLMTVANVMSIRIPGNGGISYVSCQTTLNQIGSVLFVRIFTTRQLQFDWLLHRTEITVVRLLDMPSAASAHASICKYSSE